MLQITPMERMALKLLAQGTPPRDIAHTIGVRTGDVGSYMMTLFAKMGVSGSAEAIASAARRGLLVTDS